MTSSERYTTDVYKRQVNRTAREKALHDLQHSLESVAALNQLSVSRRQPATEVKCG